jgi:hypothetical protein
MNAMKKAAAAATTTLVTLLLPLTGCTAEHTPTQTLEISDVSGSALNETAGLNNVAKTVLSDYIDKMEPGDKVTLYAFNHTPGNSCEPITASFPKQANSEQTRQLKAQLLAAAPATYDEYVTCVRNKKSAGDPGPGSTIFGAIAEAVVNDTSNPRVVQIHLVTDGCSYGENADTCVPEMTQPNFAESIIKGLPAALKPNLSGIHLVVQGLGQGTTLSTEQISVLRDILKVYAKTTGSTVEFRR